jgi:predicted GNAT family N-acyltransferase
MPATQHVIEPLNPAKHQREGFDCGVETLNRYLWERAGQDMRRRVAGCWVLIEKNDPARILGYYTLSAASVNAEELTAISEAVRKKLPRYSEIGAMLLGRLAVSAAAKGKGFGRKLLFDAIARCATSEIPAPLLVVDAKHQTAADFYLRHDFEKLSGGRLFLPLHASRVRPPSLD